MTGTANALPIVFLLWLTKTRTRFPPSVCPAWFEPEEAFTFCWRDNALSQTIYFVCQMCVLDQVRPVAQLSCVQRLFASSELLL